MREGVSRAAGRKEEYMSWKKVTRVCLSTGILVLLPSPGFAQQNCEQIRKTCLDHCHYAPQHQWTSGFKCKRECTKQVEACRSGMRGYPPRYRYGDRGGYGYGYGYGSAPQQPTTQAPYGGAAQQPAAPVAGYGQQGYPAYGRGGYAAPAQRGYATPTREQPYTGP